MQCVDVLHICRLYTSTRNLTVPVLVAQAEALPARNPWAVASDRVALVCAAGVPATKQTAITPARLTSTLSICYKTLPPVSRHPAATRVCLITPSSILAARSFAPLDCKLYLPRQIVSQSTRGQCFSALATAYLVSSPGTKRICRARGEGLGGGTGREQGRGKRL